MSTSSIDDNEHLEQAVNPECNEGTIYQRGPAGQVPRGQSINNTPGAYGTIGQPEHVTVYGDGWHRSWNNPGTTEDHSTYHAPHKIIQH